MEGVQAAMTTRNIEPHQWRNRVKWRLVSAVIKPDGYIEVNYEHTLSRGIHHISIVSLLQEKVNNLL
jgi:hypothetical protein